MKLKIWQDEKGRHTSLDGIELIGVLLGLDLCNRPHHPAEVTLHLFMEKVEVDVDADILLEVRGDTYCLKAIQKG